MTPVSDVARLDFDITFHGPFHVARGQAAGGNDRTVDRKQLLPASSLKGLLRAEAREQLELRRSLIDEVFGARRPSPWVWSDASMTGPGEVRRSARIRIGDAERGQAEDEFLMIGQQVWATSAVFSVEQWSEIPPERIADHLLVLTAAALSVTALGGARRRGEGWVSISRRGFTWDADSTTSLLELREDAA